MDFATDTSLAVMQASQSDLESRALNAKNIKNKDLKVIEEAAKDFEGIEIRFGFLEDKLLLEQEVKVSGDDLQDASVTVDQQSNMPIVLFSLKPSGAKRMGELTGENLKKQINNICKYRCNRICQNRSHFIKYLFIIYINIKRSYLINSLFQFINFLQLTRQYSSLTNQPIYDKYSRQNNHYQAYN